MKRAICILTAAAAALTAVAAGPSSASPEGRKNTAIGLTAASIYALTQDKDTLGLVGAAGSAYAWHQYNKSHQKQVANRAYRSGYSAARRSGSTRTYSASRSVRPAARAVAAARPAAPKVVAQTHRELLPAYARADQMATGATYVPGYVMVPATAGLVNGATYPVAQVQPASYNTMRPVEDTNGSGATPWLVGLSAFALGVGGTLAATSRRRSADLMLGSARRAF